MEHTPALETSRLILRAFTPRDAGALLSILGDREVNTFLPMFPLKSVEEAGDYLRTHASDGLRYAICLKPEDTPIGYINVSGGESRDLGYGLHRAYWCRGIAAEAGRAVVEALRRAGVPYVTATHDVNNPASGAVMRKLGMTYRYSYVEQWQPKDFPVTFRMYQLNLDGREDRVYRAYWEAYPNHFVEDLREA